MSLKQTKIVLGGIRADLGRKKLPPYYREHAHQQSHILEEFFKVEKMDFITETQTDTTMQCKPVWAVWADILSVIDFINFKREATDISTFLIKVMADTGQKMTKVCFNIMPFEESDGNKPRATNAQGGILAKGSSLSGVNKCIMVFCAPQIKEMNNNLDKIFNLIKLDQLFVNFNNVVFTGDFKLLNEVYGIMQASSKHPCIYCLAPEQQLESGILRTFGDLRGKHEEWRRNGSKKKDCKNDFNVNNPTLLKSIPNETLVLSITPHPTLHILLGVFNHIWKNMEELSVEHQRACRDFAIKHNCMREEYWGNTFEGNECSKLMNKLESDSSLLSTLPGTENHIEALQKCNTLLKNYRPNLYVIDK